MLGYVSTNKAGRKSLLSAAVLLAISAAIMQLVNSGVETYALIIRPIVRQEVINGGQEDLLIENKGPFGISTSWINNFCRGMGLRMRRGTTAAQKVPHNSQEVVDNMNMRVAVLVDSYTIPKPCVLNWDQTAIKFCHTANVSRAVCGVKDVQIFAKEDKRQITAVFAAAACGFLLPPQLILGGTTYQSLPATFFAKGPPVKATPGHPASGGKMNEGGLLPGRVAKFKDWSWAVTDNHWSSQVRS